jgi:hypothetical protein
VKSTYLADDWQCPATSACIIFSCLCCCSNFSLSQMTSLVTRNILGMKRLYWTFGLEEENEIHCTAPMCCCFVAGEMGLTDSGFHFLLMDTYNQLWLLLREYIRSAEKRSGYLPLASLFVHSNFVAGRVFLLGPWHENSCSLFCNSGARKVVWTGPLHADSA